MSLSRYHQTLIQQVEISLEIILYNVPSGAQGSLCCCPLNNIELILKYIQKVCSHPLVPTPSGSRVSVQGGGCPQMMAAHQKPGGWGCPFSLGCHCSFKTAGFPFLEIMCLLKWHLHALPSLLHHFFPLAFFCSL